MADVRLVLMKLFRKKLSVGEITQQVYERIFKKESEPFKLSRPAFCEIANDTGYHGIRIGYMRHEEGKVVDLNGKSWFISRGESVGDYPRKPYNSDIIVSQTTEPPLIEVVGAYFGSSLIVGMSNGDIVFPSEGDFGRRLEERVGDDVEQFISKPIKTNTSPVIYKPELVDFLVEQIEYVLRETTVSK